MTSWLLLPSPLLGPASWEPVADLLRGMGEPVTVARADGATNPADVLEQYVAASRALDAPVVVPHSNAGYYAPAVAAVSGAIATVYVDAALAAPAGPATLAPPAFLNFLAGLVDGDGLLPPWSHWWPDTDPFPHDVTGTRVEAAQPRMPLAYFHGVVDAPAGWESRPSGYLAFGDTYAEEIGRARALDWPVRRLDAHGRGGHLFLLHDPAATVAAMRRISTAVTRN